MLDKSSKEKIELELIQSPAIDGNWYIHSMTRGPWKNHVLNDLTEIISQAKTFEMRPSANNLRFFVYNVRMVHWSVV